MRLPTVQNFSLKTHSDRLLGRQKMFSRFLKSTDLLVLSPETSRENLFAGPAVAVVGSRRPTSYGLRFVRDFLRAWKGLDWTLVSGGALGIDCEAHVAALRGGFRSHAWVVGPIECPSPRWNSGLFDELAMRPGCAVLTPKCLEPKTSRHADPNNPLNFSKSAWPERNAWIVASSDALVVVEASLKSGTWSTVRMAQHVGIPVFLLPGRVDSPQSEGIHQMISIGYGDTITSVENLMQSLIALPEMNSYNDRHQPEPSWHAGCFGGASIQTTSSQSAPKFVEISRILLALLERPGGLAMLEVPDLALQTGHTMAEILKALYGLEGMGELRNLGDRFERRGKFYEP